MLNRQLQIALKFVFWVLDAIQRFQVNIILYWKELNPRTFLLA